MQFCNTTTQIMAAISHHMKQDTSIINILHYIKLVIAVCSGFLHTQFKKHVLTNNLQGELFFLK
jgi:hypothetical protein